MTCDAYAEGCEERLGWTFAGKPMLESWCRPCLLGALVTLSEIVEALGDGARRMEWVRMAHPRVAEWLEAMREEEAGARP